MTRYVVAALMLCAISCEKKEESTPYETLGKASWLIGEWQNRLPQGQLTEIWTKDNDSTYSARSYFVKTAGDTLHLEAITLEEKASGVLYTPTVQGQNNNQPVSFKMTSSDENSMTFENPQHDYPSKIVYRRISADSIVAEISGVQRGQPSSESYPMGRRK